MFDGCGIHSHNDQFRKRPLLDALENLCMCIEPDTYLLNDEFIIAHDWDDAVDSKNRVSLVSSYLIPLCERVSENFISYGRRELYPELGLPRFYPVNESLRPILMIDCKLDVQNKFSEGILPIETFFDHLSLLLFELNKKYPETFVVCNEYGIVSAGAIQVVLTGIRPSSDWLKTHSEWVISLDGRLPQILCENPSQLADFQNPFIYPIISEYLQVLLNGESHRSVIGAPSAYHSLMNISLIERSKIASLAALTHSRHQIFRIWGCEDSEESFLFQKNELNLHIVGANDVQLARKTLTQNMKK